VDVVADLTLAADAVVIVVGAEVEVARRGLGELVEDDHED